MILQKENMEQALELLSGQATVLVPVRDGKNSKFTPWRKGVTPNFDMVNTTLPPKDALFPQTEKMFRFHTGGGDAAVEEIVDLEKQVLFGVRPCDAASIACMDQVFLTKTYVDSFYARKRENLTLVAMGCAKAEESCFCSSMGLDPGKSPEADVLLTPTGTGWLVHAQTAKGEALLGTLEPVLSEGADTPLPPAVCTLQADMEGVAEKLTEMFDHPIWDQVWHPCLGCGTCTYLCPTCYCFEIGAETSGSQGVQLRCWDSCMFSEYSRMAGGLNPRPTKRERVRNRYLHKLSYFKERYGHNLCVGCGRCLRKCPVGMDIVRVIELVREAETQWVQV